MRLTKVESLCRLETSTARKSIRVEMTVDPSLHHHRRQFLATSIVLSSVWTSLESQAQLPCPGVRGYELKQCLSTSPARERRNASSEDPSQLESSREEYLKLRQFEQPGEMITLGNGLQYREFEKGNSASSVEIGSLCSVSYIVYRLSSGAYFKYSSGGTPIYLFSVGYGYEGKDDVDAIYQFRYGEKGVLPLAVAGAIQGMKEGGRRRILVPPQLGWIDDTVNPRPDTFGGSRRLASHRNEPLLFEIEMKRIQSKHRIGDGRNDGDDAAEESKKVINGVIEVPENAPFSLPAPPPSFQK